MTPPLDTKALYQYLGQHLPDFKKHEVTLSQFKGGQSNPTFKLTCNDKCYVLRKQPKGKLLASAHQVDREYRVMHALKDSDIPVPDMLLLCDDPEIISGQFYLMSMVEGTVHMDVTLPSHSPEMRRSIYVNLLSTLGKLHRVQHEDIGLSDFGKTGNYYERQFSRWRKQYRACETEWLPAMEKLIDWLPQRLVQSDEVSIVHGDYRLGNVLIDDTSGQLTAVLDWELSTLGHPLADLGYLCQEYHGYSLSNKPSLIHSDLKHLGIPEEQEALDIYCEHSGRSQIDNWYFYIIFNLFRSASICQGVYRRGIDGNAASDTAHQFRQVAERFSQRGAELAEQHF